MKKWIVVFCILTMALGNISLASTNQVIEYNGKPTPNSIVEIYAHRGGRGLAPENTMPAYQSALRQGVDYIDMDVGVTKDGVVVVTHDLTLNPDITRDKNGNYIKKAIPIHGVTYKELETYDVGKLKPGTQYASFFPMQHAMNKVKIPTLKEVIEYTKKIAGDQVGFQIEIKTDPKNPQLTPSLKEFAKAVYQILDNENVINCTEVQAFDFRCLIELQKLDKNIKTAYLTANNDNESKENGTLWTAGYNIKDYDNSMLKMIKSLGGAAWEPYEMDLTRAQLEQAHQLGLKVVVWGWPEQEGTEFNYQRIVELINWY